METACKRCCSKNLQFEKFPGMRFDQNKIVCMDCGYEF
jgi:hypothetical protein